MPKIKPEKITFKKRYMNGFIDVDGEKYGAFVITKTERGSRCGYTLNHYASGYALFAPTFKRKRDVVDLIKQLTDLVPAHIWEQESPFDTLDRSFVWSTIYPLKDTKEHI